MEDKILNNNKLIAEFMGCRKWPDRDGYVTKFGNINSAITTLIQLRFHKEWDWIMPVVDKICDYESVGDFEICNSWVQIIAAIEVDEPINDILIDHSGGDDKKRAVFEACVKFIKQIK